MTYILKDLMTDTTITHEMERHPVIVFIKVKHDNLETGRFLKVSRPVVCKVRKNLLNENNGNESAVKGKRKCIVNALLTHSQHLSL